MIKWLTNLNFVNMEQLQPCDGLVLLFVNILVIFCKRNSLLVFSKHLEIYAITWVGEPYTL